ncbi:MAG: TRAP transporter substrate-binding protein DctP [Alphaproteobacteria bacterium]
MSMERFFGAAAGAAAIAALMSVSSAPVNAQEILLRTQVPNVEDEDYDGMVVFKDFVEARSNGTIGVEIVLGNQICSNGTECLEALEDGVLDVYISTSGGAANLFPFVQVLDLPYILRDDRVAEIVLSGEFQDHMRRAGLEQSGEVIRLMTIGNTGGWRNFANTKRVVKTPSDLEGLKIRTIVADLPQVLVESLGASSTPIPWPELFTSFQTGVVEGSKNGITDIMNMSFPDAGLQFLTLDGHAYMAALWWMNNERYMGMSDEQKGVVLDGFKALQQATFASPKRKSIQAYQDFVSGGGTIYVPTPDEKAQWQAAATPVYDWFAGNVEGGETWLSRLRASAGEAEAQIDAENAGRLN